jgi:hypothetical protein
MLAPESAQSPDLHCGCQSRAGRRCRQASRRPLGVMQSPSPAGTRTAACCHPAETPLVQDHHIGIEHTSTRLAMRCQLHETGTAALFSMLNMHDDQSQCSAVAQTAQHPSVHHTCNVLLHPDDNHGALVDIFGGVQVCLAARKLCCHCLVGYLVDPALRSRKLRSQQAQPTALLTASCCPNNGQPNDLLST